MSTKVAVVTGSNKGIGLAIVRALCKQFQGDVYLTARDVGRGQEAVKSLDSEGLKAKFHQLDINDLNSIITAAAFFKDKYGGVDVLVNNAGIAFKVADTTPFAVQAEVTLKTNFFATRDMLTHFLPIVKAGGDVKEVGAACVVMPAEEKEKHRERAERVGGDSEKEAENKTTEKPVMPGKILQFEKDYAEFADQGACLITATRC
eukprot:superscaffoldBa00005824_g20826